MGDYDKVEHRKGKEPTICRRIRKILRQNDYKVYLINEFRTSKLCYHCEEECENFLLRPSKKPKHVKSDKLFLCWGLTRCTSEKCKLIHNRDKNATLNMYKIVMEILAGRKRPVKYCREKQSTSFALNDAI
jgi:transposase